MGISGTGRVRARLGRRGRLCIGALTAASAAALMAGWVPATASATGACGTVPSDSYSQAVLGDAPVAYYRLDEGAGSTICDASPSANNGTYASGVTQGQPGAIAEDSAVSVRSPSSGVGTSAANAGLTGNHSFTFEAWFQKTSTVQNQSLVNVGQSGKGMVAGLSTWTSSTGDHTASQLVLDLYVGAPAAGTNNIWDTSAAGVNLWDGQWHYLAVTYAAGSDVVNGFVDGHGLGAVTPPASINLQASAIRLGAWVDTVINQRLIGDEDDVAVYGKPLTASQVKAHFLASARPYDNKVPVITGTAQSGHKLAASKGTWTQASALTFTRQWMQCTAPTSGCTAIAHATHATYTVKAADVGDYVTVVVTATNASGQQTSVSAKAVGPVTS